MATYKGLAMPVLAVRHRPAFKNPRGRWELSGIFSLNCPSKGFTLFKFCLPLHLLILEGKLNLLLGARSEGGLTAAEPGVGRREEKADRE